MTSLAPSLTSLPSRIDSVTVFHHGALVRRVASVSLDPDSSSQRVRFAGLPLMIDDASLRVSLVEKNGAPAAHWFASETHVALEPPDGDAPHGGIEDELREARRVEAHIRVARDAAWRDVSVVKDLVVPARAKGANDAPPGATPTLARLAFVELQEKELAALHKRLAELNEQLLDASEKVEHLAERLRQATTDQPARPCELRKSVIVGVQRLGDAPAADLELHLEYLLPGATWGAMYRLEFDRTLSKAHLAFRAVVRQQTGEDWSQAAVTLSTALPSAWRELPELASRRIGRRQLARPTGWRAPPTGASILFADFDREKAFAKARWSAQYAATSGAARKLLLRRQEIIAGRQWPIAAESTSPTPTASEGPPPPAAPTVRHMEKAPPPRPMAAHSPVPPMPPASTRATSPQGGILGAVAAAGAAMFGAGRDEGDAKADGNWRNRSFPKGASLFAGGADSSQTARALPTNFYNFGRLSLASLDDQHRGELHFRTTTEIYSRLSLELGWRTGMEFFGGAWGRASRRAATVDDEPPSPDCRTWRDPQGYDHAYAAESRLDVPSDGRPHAVAVLARGATARARYVCVPRESSQVFRLAEFDNPLDAPLPPGPVDVVVGGEYLLTSKLGAVAPRSPARLGLGVEPAIKVARNTRYREEAANFLGGSLDLIHELTIEIGNRLDRSARVEIRERIPTKVEGDENIAVTTLPADPPWSPYVPEDGSALEGGYHWTIDVAAGKSTTLKGGYTVRIASKNELRGGNRREG